MLSKPLVPLGRLLDRKRGSALMSGRQVACSERSPPRPAQCHKWALIPQKRVNIIIINGSPYVQNASEKWKRCKPATRAVQTTSDGPIGL